MVDPHYKGGKVSHDHFEFSCYCLPDIQRNDKSDPICTCTPKTKTNHKLLYSEILHEVGWRPYSWAGWWIVWGRSVSQPGSDIASPPRSERHRGSLWGTAHTHSNPEDTYNWLLIYAAQGHTYCIYTMELSFPPGCRRGASAKHTNLVSSSPRLPLQSCCLLVDSHLVLFPAALYNRDSHHPGTAV